jgi:DNA helicase HerA-like ATPase
MTVDDQLASFRTLRRELEERILPLATSVDGRRFMLQASLHGLAFEAGGYLVLEGDGVELLGQLYALEPTQAEGPELQGELKTRMTIRAAAGQGVVLDGDGRPFHDALARPARPDEVAAHLEAVAAPRARLAVGELLLAPGVSLDLDAGGFDRHTFLCGQSGSGKTYALGAVLERLLHQTRLRIVVLDPNSDFVRLAETRADADPAAAARHAEVAPGIVVRRAGDGLKLRVADLDPAVQAALLRLDPVADREEYAALVGLLESGAPLSLGELADERLTLRIRNLRVDRWGIWSRGEDASIVDDVLEGGARCLVIDLGSLPTREEQELAATAVLAALWRERERREPVLVVIDEAHNVLPAEPEDALTAQSAELAIRIAAEGRKFGLYLLVSTQRPQKVHANVLSQCDNLLLMRMNSLADLAYVGDVFSFVPPTLLARATAFRQGECLAAGKIAPHPALMRIGARISVEGGGDVPATWAAG